MENRTLISRIIHLLRDQNGGKPVAKDTEELVIIEKPVQVPMKPNTWGLSGRSDMMKTRNMMQLKAFHK